MIKVGFIISLGGAWHGGVNYYRNLFDAICSIPEKKIQPVIITGNNNDTSLFKNFPPVEILRTSLLDGKTFPKRIRTLLKILFKRDILLENFLKKNNINILSHSCSLGPKVKIPTICWIPDFQHKYFPDFFSRKEIQLRDRYFQDICNNCTCVLLSSFSAQNDLYKFYPSCKAKSAVLRFVACLPVNLQLLSLEELEKRYNFSGIYFHLPNQFWAHKNHIVVIEALKILIESNLQTLIIATGNPHDYRQPDFFKNLMNKVNQYGLQDHFRVLGRIPYNDVIALMKNSVAVINPSLFEGWSTTVEEAKSIGANTILSNINVHKEQMPEKSIFFDPYDPKALAETIKHSLEEFDPILKEKHITNAAQLLPKRKLSFALEYQNLVKKFAN